MAEDDETPWYRSLLVGVGALVGVAVLVGGVVGLVTLGAVNVVGIGETRQTVRAEPSLHIPERTPREKQDLPGLTLDDLNPDRSQSAAPDGEPSASAEPEQERPKARKKKEPRSTVSLSASPLEVSPMGRIYLSGTYPGGEGASLQVQRREGGWKDFPTSTSVSGGTFSTYVMTGQSGPNRFRVVDPASGRTSNVVTVRVR